MQGSCCDVLLSDIVCASIFWHSYENSCTSTIRRTSVSQTVVRGPPGVLEYVLGGPRIRSVGEKAIAAITDDKMMDSSERGSRTLGTDNTYSARLRVTTVSRISTVDPRSKNVSKRKFPIYYCFFHYHIGSIKLSGKYSRRTGPGRSRRRHSACGIRRGRLATTRHVQSPGGPGARSRRG